jgi:hypothetical protein
MPEPIIAPEPVLKMCFINRFHQSVCLSVCVSLLSPLGNGSVKTLPQQRIHTQQWKNCWTFSFLSGTCRIEGSWRSIIPRTSCFIVYIVIFSHFLQLLASFNKSEVGQMPTRTPASMTDAQNYTHLLLKLPYVCHHSVAAPVDNTTNSIQLRVLATRIFRMVSDQTSTYPFSVVKWLDTGFGLVIEFIALLQTVNTINYSAIANSHTYYNSLQHTLSLLSLLCLHQSLLGNGSQRRRFLSFRFHVLTDWRLSDSSSWPQFLAIAG